MKLPRLRGNGPVELRLSEFGGLDIRPGRDNGIKKIYGFTEEDYPIYRTEPLSYQRSVSVPADAEYKMEKLLGQLAVCLNGSFYYPEGTYRGTLTQPVRCFGVMNDIIYLFPSKQYYDTVTQTFGSMERERTAAAGTLCFEDGTLYGEAAAANTIHCDTADFSVFHAGDAVTVSGCSALPENNKTAIIRELDETGHKLRFSENCFAVGTESGSVSIKVSVPDLDDVCVCENRMWGYHGRTIYASKLGDPLNWAVYDGISTDSYTVSVDGEGNLTACTSFLGYPVFFRERQIYKVYGDKPSNFSLTAGAHSGVRAGAARSVCAVEDTLYYLSEVGMVSYSGGIPSALLEFGIELHDCVCASDGKRLYVLSGERLFRYTPRLRLWTELKPEPTESNFVLFDIRCGNGYPVCFERNGTGVRLSTSARGAAAEGGVWSASDGRAEIVLGDFYLNKAEKLHIHEVTLRLTADSAAVQGSITALLHPDGGTGITMNERSIPRSDGGREYCFTAIPRRCSSFRISLSITANARISILSAEFRN